MPSHNFKDITGKVFGRLLALRLHGTGRENRAMWICRCSCGQEKIVSGKALRDGRTNSCGCLSREILAKRNFKHGHASRGSAESEYGCWLKIRQRCENPNCPDYKDYGARGISVCGQWRESFETFLADMGKKPSLDLSIHRLDNNQGYHPANCVWADDAVQANNKTNSHILEFCGKSQTVTQWARELHMHQATLSSRLLDSGWSVERALTTPVRKCRRLE